MIDSHAKLVVKHKHSKTHLGPEKGWHEHVLPIATIYSGLQDSDIVSWSVQVFKSLVGEPPPAPNAQYDKKYLRLLMPLVSWEKLNRVVYDPVLQPCVEIQVGNLSLICSDDQEFITPDIGWIPLDQLKPRQYIMMNTVRGRAQYARISQIKRVSSRTGYNLDCRNFVSNDFISRSPQFVAGYPIPKRIAMAEILDSPTDIL